MNYLLHSNCTIIPIYLVAYISYITTIKLNITMAFLISWSIWFSAKSTRYTKATLKYTISFVITSSLNRVSKYSLKNNIIDKRRSKSNFLNFKIGFFYTILLVFSIYVYILSNKLYL